MPPPSLIIKTQLKGIPPWQADNNSDNEDDDHIYHSRSTYHDQYEYEEDDIILDHTSSMTSSPSIPDENIDFDSVYALHAFVATVEGQANANKGDALLLMEDENTYWWLVEVLHSGEIGYIPAENIETPYERLARLNKHRNVEITTPVEDDLEMHNKNSARSILSRRQPKNLFVDFGPPRIIEFEPETEEEDSDECDEDEYEWEDMDYNQRYYEDEYEGDYQERYQAYDDMDSHEEHVEYQPEKVRNLLHERIKDRQLEEQQRSQIYHAINESHNIETIESIESESITSSDEDEIQILRKKQPSTSSEHTNHMPQIISRPIPAARLVEPKTIRTSLEITELEPVIQPVAKPTKRDGMTRSRSKDSIQSMNTQLTVLRVFAGNIKQGTGFKTVMVTPHTTAQELVKQAMVKFHIEELESDSAVLAEYYATVKGIDGHESTLDPEDKPLSIYQTLTNHLTTPMPSVEHIKRLSNTQIHVTRLGVLEKDKSQNGTGHFGEDSIIRFYLHRRMKRSSARVDQMYIKISLFLDKTETTTTAIRSYSAFSLTNRKKKYVSSMAEDANRIDKIICVNMNDLVSEVIYLALDKFHITNGVPDGPQDSGYIPEDLVRYRLLVQSQGSEVELNYRDTMNSVMECHRLSNRQQAHLTFILRKASEPMKPKNEYKTNSSLQIRTPNRSALDSSSLLSPGLERQRRPSILDILMDTPKDTSANQQNISDMLQDSPKILEKPPFLNDDGQRGTVDRKYSNSSHVLSDMSESRKSSFASLLSGDNPHKTVRSVSTTPTSPMDISTDRSRQMSLTSFASTSSIISDDAQKNVSTQAVGNNVDQNTTERREKSFTLSLRKIVPWSAKSKRNDPNHNIVTNSSSQATDLDVGKHGNNNYSKPLRSTLPVDGYSDRGICQSGSYRADTASFNDPLIPKSRPVAEITVEKPPTPEPEAITEFCFHNVAPPVKSSDDDNNNYATYAKWLNSLPNGDTTGTDATNNSYSTTKPTSVVTSQGTPASASSLSKTDTNPKDDLDSEQTTNLTSSLASVQDIATGRKHTKALAETVHNPELGELSYLITNGIGFLETKEGSKWDDDGGYEFHPWNRSKSSYISETKTLADEVESLSIGEKSVSDNNSTISQEKTGSRLAPEYVSKVPVAEAKDMEQELARIVAAHIVF